MLYFTLKVADASHVHTSQIHRSNIDERALSDDVRQTSSPYTSPKIMNIPIYEIIVTQDKIKTENENKILNKMKLEAHLLKH